MAGNYECTSCPGDGGLGSAKCQGSADQCPSTNNDGGSLCPCASQDAGQCLGDRQACVDLGMMMGFFCLTCGQGGGGTPDTMDKDCKNGMKCNAATGICDR
jgi:hypothetical protein